MDVFNCQKQKKIVISRQLKIRKKGFHMIENRKRRRF